MRTIILDKTEQLYEFKKHEITVTRTGVDTMTRSVYFRSNKPTTIKSGKFAEWNCGLSTENERCDKVRNGQFHWLDTYTITFNGTFLTFLFQSNSFPKK